MKQEFQIKGELITLDALLKAVGAADSGAHAKAMVAEGLVRVDGEVELRKTRKLRGGERVELEGLCRTGLSPHVKIMQKCRLPQETGIFSWGCSRIIGCP